MTGMVRVFALALLTTLAWPSAMPAQETRPASTTVPDRAVARTAFEQLLDQLDAVRLDPALADADEIAAARAALKTALGQFHSAMTAEWTAARGMPLADRDYVSFRNACAPRLDGTVVRIGPGQPFLNIATALP